MTSKTSLFDDIMAALDDAGDGNYAESFNFENAGDTIVGKYISLEEEVGKYASNVYTIEDGDGKQWSVWGNVVLDDGISEAEFGDTVGIRYLGMVKRYRNYSVVIRKAGA